MRRILAVDDDIKILRILSDIFKDEFEVDFARTGKEALSRIDGNYSLAILDLKLPDINGLELLIKVKEKAPGLPVIILTGFGTIDDAVRAIKYGADDFIEKPVDKVKLKMRVESVLKKVEYENIIKLYEELVGEHYRIIFKSRKMKEIMDVVDKIKDLPVNVLILGETGVGKELIARAIHFKGVRKGKPFVKINCAAIPDTLFEAELFGYEKGAFTDAKSSKKGKAEIANGGSLFLDEISELSLLNQSKVLHLIEDKEFYPLGSEKKKKVDVRIISASNKDIFEETRRGNFREDLLARINVVTLRIPPLRERKEDIPVIADYYLKKFSEEYNTPLKILDDSAVEYLMKLNFKRNVRDLRNLMERCVIFVKNEVIKKEHIIKLTGNEMLEEEIEIRNLKEARKDFERDYILKALKLHNWKIEKTAKALGIHRTHLIRKMKELGIEK